MTDTIRMRILKKSAAALLGAALAQGGSAYAQETPSLMEMSSDAFDAVVTLGTALEDNIFSTRNDKESDQVTILSPSIAYGKSIGSFDLTAQAGAELGWYKSNSAEDYQDYSASLELSRKLVADGKVYAGIRFGRDHEERQSPDDENGFEPTLFSQPKAYAGYRSRTGRWRTTLVGTIQTLNFDDAESVGGRINNDDRDRDLVEIGLRLAKKTTDEIELFGQLTYDVRDYRPSMTRVSKGTPQAVGHLSAYVTILTRNSMLNYSEGSCIATIKSVGSKTKTTSTSAHASFGSQFQTPALKRASTDRFWKQLSSTHPDINQQLGK